MHRYDTMHNWRSALRYTWRTAFRLDRSQITVVPAIRSAIGFALPLALGVATGHVGVGVSLAGGAMTLGSVGLTYSYHARIRTMLLACVGIALSAFVGSITGPIDWLVIPVVGLWGLGAGLLVAVGQPAMVIGLQSTVALIILSHFALPPVLAAQQAALMFAGALFQTLLAWLPVPWRRAAAERAALADVYQKLAAYARDPADQLRGSMLRDAFVKAHALLAESNTQQRNAPMLALLETAEHLRLSMLIATQLPTQDLALPDKRINNAETLAAYLQTNANQIQAIAYELTRSTLPHRTTRTERSVHHQQFMLANGNPTQGDSMPLFNTTLHDQIASAMQLARSWDDHSQQQAQRLSFVQSSVESLRSVQASIRANLSFRSATFRHAVRLGVTLALATALYRLVQLPIQHGYWIPLTALLVLRSDFSTTFTRGVARMVGTVMGAVIATVLVSLLAPTNALLVLVDVLAAYLAFSVLLANYALFSAFVTLETVILLFLATYQPEATAVDRAAATAIGGVLALLIYLLWPTWEHVHAPRYIASYLERLRTYIGAVLTDYGDPSIYNQRTLDKLRAESRLARSNLAASIQRLQHEPGSHDIDTNLAQELLDTTETLAQSALALDAYLIANPTRQALPEIRPFATQVDAALLELITATREQQPASPLPDLQATLQGFEGTGITPSLQPELRFVLTEARRVVYAIDTMRQLLADNRETLPHT